MNLPVKLGSVRKVALVSTLAGWERKKRTAALRQCMKSLWSWTGERIVVVFKTAYIPTLLRRRF